VWGKPMFPKVNTLPGSERNCAMGNWDGKVHCGEGRSDMSRHVILAFVVVDEQGIAILYKASKEALQIAAHIGVGVFLDQERGGRMANVQSQEAILESVPGNPCVYRIREFVETTAASVNCKFMGDLAEHGCEIKSIT
jgi:hypothetical protein